MRTDSKKRSLRLGKFIASVYDVYFPRDHGHYGTDADHVPVIPGNDLAPEVGGSEVHAPCSLARPQEANRSTRRVIFQA